MLTQPVGTIMGLISLMMVTSSTWAQDKVLPEGSTLAGVLNRGSLKVCFEAPFVPFEMVDRSGGLRERSLRSGDERRGAQITKFAGFDIDIGRTMARELGVDYVPVNTRWNSIIISLNLGRCDIIIGGMSITEDRSEQVDFSDPYLMAGQTVILADKHRDKVKSYEDLNDAAFNVASHPNTTGETAIRELLPDATYVSFDDDAEAIEQVRRGDIDAFIYDLPFNSVYLAMHGSEGLIFLSEAFTEEGLGWAIRKNDPEFLDWLNSFLADIKEDGRLDALYDKWFVETGWFGQYN